MGKTIGTTGDSAYAFGWPSTIATIVVGAFVSISMLFQLGRRVAATVEIPEGAWESRAIMNDGIAATRRIVFTGPRQGRWTESRVDRGTEVSLDAAQFEVEGPRANRFCIAATAGTRDCRLLQVSRDSLVMVFGTPTVSQPFGQSRWVFLRVK